MTLLPQRTQVSSIVLSPSVARTILNIEDGATADQSDAEIKTAYENNADTNAFDDAEQTKLAGIESGAKVGDVVGPGTIVDNAMVRFDSTSGKLVQSTGIIVDDSDFVTGMAKLTVDDVVIDAELIEARLSSQSIAIRGGSDAGKVVTVGRAGDTTLGDGTLRVMYPQTDEKIDLGKTTNRFNEVHAVSFVPKSRVAWTLIGSEALDRTVDWGATYTNDQLRDILLSVIKDSIAEGRF